uniref:Uncharacterized protein n=1 Tax=Panagrolaimus sp. JU765 TaxID=591449 RepID=A0AC34QJ24_9BILA
MEGAALLKKIKILCECNKNLSYETLKKELNIGTDDELEKFMFDILQSKTVIGTLDGVKKELKVTATEKREFDRKDWMKLKNNLGILLENLNHIKKNIDSVCQPDE